jgi:hypothetical protein
MHIWFQELMKCHYKIMQNNIRKKERMKKKGGGGGYFNNNAIIVFVAWSEEAQTESPQHN